MSRFSCRFCVVAGQHDLWAAAHVPENAGLFLELVDIEITSTYSFQSDRWLADVAPHLLDERRRAALVEAKERATARIAAEARIPRHLLYEKGWPKVMPTRREAALLAEVRCVVAQAVGIAVGYTDADSILARYAYLMAAGERKRAEQERKDAIKARRLAA